MTSRQGTRQGAHAKNKQQLEPLEQSPKRKSVDDRKSTIFPSLSTTRLSSASTVNRGVGAISSEGNGGVSGATTPRGFDDKWSFTNQGDMSPTQLTQGVNLQQWYLRAKQIHDEYKQAPPIALMV